MANAPARPWSRRNVGARLGLVSEAVRKTLGASLPSARLDLMEMRQLLAPQLRPWRLGATLFSVLSALALIISAVGLYGVIAYGVRARTRELGIRLALG